VKNWAYTYRFLGRVVPPRVTAWPWLRRVKLETTTRLFGELVAGMPAPLRTPDLWRAIVSRSPITELCDVTVAPSFSFSQATIRVLADRALRSGIARRIAQDPRRKEQIDKLGTALDALGTVAPPVALYCALALVYEVHVTALLGRDERGAWTTPQRGAEIFAAVLPVVSASDLPFGPSALSPSDRARVEREARAVLVPKDLLLRMRPMLELASQAEGVT